MSRRFVSSGSPFEEQAGYSRAVSDGSYVHVAGTTGYDYATMTMPGDVETQARNAFATIAKALEDAGSHLDHTVRATYYITDRAHAPTLFAVAGEVFKTIKPAATLLICDLLNEDMLVEIEVTATLQSPD